jgi:SOS response regulatory protein OraA/RecX
MLLGEKAYEKADEKQAELERNNSQSELGRNNSQSELERAKAYALNILERSRKSSEALAEKLRQKNYSQSVISELIDTYKEVNLLDDASFADAIIHDCLHIKHYNCYAIRGELIKRKIPKTIIDEKINEIESFHADELDKAVDLFIASKVRKSSTLPRDKQIFRVYGQVVRKLGMVDDLFSRIECEVDKT